MGINVQLRSDGGEILAEVRDDNMVLARASHSALSGTRLLRYLVPWGDAVFNQAQADDLAHDIRDLRIAHANTALSDLLEDIDALVTRLHRETHRYLWFVGD
jgi:hypothetical protein